MSMVKEVSLRYGNLILTIILAALATPIVKWLVMHGGKLGLSNPNAISFCNLLFVGNLCSGVVVLIYYGWKDIWRHLRELSASTGLRMRVVRMKLGDEFIELTEYLTPKGRPVPTNSRSHDRWFQHIAIIVNDMDRAYQWLSQNHVVHVSTAPQLLPDWNKNAAGIRAFYFKDSDGHVMQLAEK